MELSNTPWGAETQQAPIKEVRVETADWDYADCEDCDDCQACAECCESESPIETFSRALMSKEEHAEVKALDKEAEQQYEKWVETLPTHVETEVVTATKIAKEADVKIAEINKEANVEVAKINAEARSCNCCPKLCKSEDNSWDKRYSRHNNTTPAITFKSLTMDIAGNDMVITEKDIREYCGDSYWTFEQLESDRQVLDIILKKLFK